MAKDPGRSYAASLRELAARNARAQAQRDEAHTWYERQCVAADRAVRDARQQLERAEAELIEATEQVELVDTEAAHLWHVLRARLGFRRLGDPPGPAPGATGDPLVLLNGVRELLERLRHPGELPSSANPLLVLCGVLSAAAAYAIGVAARHVGDHYGGDLAVGMPVLALVVTLVGPVVGLAPAKLIADRRHAALGPRPVMLVLAAGAFTCTALFAVLK